MNPSPLCRIDGLGIAVPDRVVTNRDFEATLDTNDQWIVDRTGIRERRWAGRETSLASLCTDASRGALEQAGVNPADVDAIILGTVTPDHRLPSTACEIQAMLGARQAIPFDVAAACPGWIYSLAIAEGFIAAGRARTILVIGGEKLSTITDTEDRSTAILFGDGAGAALVRPAEGGPRGMISCVLGGDGTLLDLLCIPGGGSADPISHAVVEERSQFMKMKGREVFKAAVLAMATACEGALARAGVGVEDIELLVPHQANVRIIEATARHTGIPIDRVMVNVDRYGNTSTASIPLALHQAESEGRLRRDALILVVSFGAGFTWGAAVIRW